MSCGDTRERVAPARRDEHPSLVGEADTFREGSAARSAKREGRTGVEHHPLLSFCFSLSLPLSLCLSRSFLLFLSRFFRAFFLYAPRMTDAEKTSIAKTILVIDDEKNIRRTLGLVLEGEGYQVVGAETAEEGLSILANPAIPVDLAIFDVQLPEMSGLEALERVRKDDALKETPVIVISGHATVNDAVSAIKLGASDFFEKPLARERVLGSVRNVLDAAQAKRALAEASKEQLARYEMIGASQSMQKVFREIEKVAPTRASVLITGESGTGKELISRAIHRLSPRAGGPFVKVNCAAIPREWSNT